MAIDAYSLGNGWHKSRVGQRVRSKDELNKKNKKSEKKRKEKKNLKIANVCASLRGAPQEKRGEEARKAGRIGVGQNRDSRGTCGEGRHSQERKPGLAGEDKVTEGRNGICAME